MLTVGAVPMCPPQKSEPVMLERSEPIKVGKFLKTKIIKSFNRLQPYIPIFC